uniref:Ubiquitin-like domain-containing protein n=1 Tax=Hanusia phi TaxID=3032 RepID=A0A7S0HDQ7_9CRYP|mmetsp:Transcript_17857/g.40457  ORF Transcript_17857/g.40457 Transcript_17857/m.40457 type:complete len:1759 (+) Transcript_17857:289-5565(+)
MQIFVRSQYGTWPLQISPTDTVNEVRRTFFDKLCLRGSDLLAITFHGKVLLESATLLSCGITSGVILNATLRLLGGGCGASTPQNAQAPSTTKQVNGSSTGNGKKASNGNAVSVNTGNGVTPNNAHGVTGGKGSSHVKAKRPSQVIGSKRLFDRTGLVGPRRTRTPWKEDLSKVLDFISSPLDQQEADVDPLKGDLSNPASLKHVLKDDRKLLKVTISAAASDTEWERSILVDDVLPFVIEYGRRAGVEVVVDDLTLGVPEDLLFSDDVLEVVRASLDESIAQSKGLAYISLIGQRYGHRFCPLRIPKTIFEGLLKHVDSSSIKLVTESFLLDNNDVLMDKQFEPKQDTVEPHYILKLRPTQNSIGDIHEISAVLRAAASKLWKDQIPNLRDPKSCHWIKRFYISLIEESFCHGLAWLDANVQKSKGMVYRRTFKSIPSNSKESAHYLDVGAKGPDQEAEKMLKELIEMIPANVQNIAYNDIPWDSKEGMNPEKSKEQGEYLKKISDEICTSLMSSVDSVAKLPSLHIDSLYAEVKQHLQFSLSVSGKYVENKAQGQLLATLHRYLKDPVPGCDKGFVAFGPMGSGKTWLLSRFVQQIMTESIDKKPAVVCRFVGLSQNSSSIAPMLAGICRQIATIYGKDDESVPENYLQVVAYFQHALATWPTPEKPLLLVIDGLDQLEDNDAARQLDWLPLSGLKLGLRIVVSTAPDSPGNQCLTTIKRKLKIWGGSVCHTIAEAPAFSEEDVQAVLEGKLQAAGRTLTAEQFEAVRQSFREKDSAERSSTPMWIALVFQIVRKWHSYDGVLQKIEASIIDLSNSYFSLLQDRHGAYLTKAALSYISLARHFGVSENELRQVLSCNDDVMSEIGSFRVINSSPHLYLKQVLHDVEPLLYQVKDSRLIASPYLWMNRFYGQAVERWLDATQERQNMKRILLKDLADHFDGTHAWKVKPYENDLQRVLKDIFPSETGNDRRTLDQPVAFNGSVTYANMQPLILNQRKLQMLMQLLIWSADESRTLKVLFSVEYIAAKFHSNAGHQLLHEMNLAISTFPALAEKLLLLKSLLLVNKEHFAQPVCSVTPFQIMSQEPDSSEIFRGLQEFLSDHKELNLCLWLNKLQTAGPLAVFYHHSSPVSCVIVSPCGKFIASSAREKCFTVTSLHTGEVSFRSMEHQGEITSLAWSPDGLIIVAASREGSIRLWDAKGGFQVGSVLSGHSGEVLGVAFNPKDPNVLVSCGKDMSVRIWDISRACCLGNLINRHTRKVNSVTFSVDGKVVATGSDDYNVCLWSADTGLLMGEPLKGHEEEVTSVAFHPSHYHVLASGCAAGTIRFWDTRDSSLIGEPLQAHEVKIAGLAFWPGRPDLLASCSNDRTIRFWSMEKRSQVFPPVQAHVSWVNSMFWTPNGDRLVSGSRDSTIKVWSMQMMSDAQMQGHKQGVNSVSFNPGTSNVVVTSSYDRTIQLWDASTGKKKGEPLRGQSGWPGSLVWSPSSSLLASGSDNNDIKIWTAEGEVKANLKGHRMAVTSLAFNPLDENMLASCSTDKTIRLWDIASASQVGEAMEGHEGWVLSLAFRRSDGAMLVSGASDKTVRVWNVSERKEVGKLEGHTGRINCVAFSPTDPNLAASASEDRTIRLWNTSTMEAVGKPLEGHTAFINQMLFLPDGETIAASSRDNVILRWSCKTGEPVSCVLSGSLLKTVASSTSKMITCKGNVMYVYEMLEAKASRCAACFKASSNIVAIDVCPPFICLGGAGGDVYHLRCDYLVE